MKILYAEDEPYLAFVIKDGLEAQGFEVLHVTDGKDAVDHFAAFGPDIVLLDYAMPVMDGIEACRRIRTKNREVPVIFASAHSLGDTIAEAYRAGATDYIKKPFGLRELLLKMETILHKAATTATQEKNTTVFSIGHYTFNTAKNELHGFGECIQLNRKESALLRELCRQEEGIVERTFLLQKYWDSTGLIYSRSLDTYIARLRKHLAADPAVKIITVKGLGYKMQITP
jgi:DNA-binding response OmpR family regulator